ncbi:MAG: cupin domain-containing protein [Deltaproteobacteria bacterium]|nr:cupin domain-containing protein [Deltaproteobacteria bacterium]
MGEGKSLQPIRFHIYQTGASGGVEVTAGTRRKTILMSPHMQVNISEKEKGSITPRHEHPEEMVGVFLRGRYRMGVGEETLEFEAGEAIYIPGDLPHGPVEVISEEPGMMLDIIAPVRGEEKPFKKEG